MDCEAVIGRYHVRRELGTEFFVAAMLKPLSATLTEHLEEGCDLHGVPCTNLKAEIPVQAKELQEVGPVPN